MSLASDTAVEEVGGAPDEPDEFAFIPPLVHETGNWVGQDMNGVQAGSVFGGLTINNSNEFASPAKLKFRLATTEELAQVSEEFLSPEGFQRASRVLAEQHVVVLSGKGAGRSFAGRRLLVDRRVSQLVYLDPETRLGSIREADLRRGEGYLWDAGDQGEHPFAGWEFRRAVATMHSLDCRLVIVLDTPRQVPVEARGCTVVLGPPNPVEVARAILTHRCTESVAQATKVLQHDLADALLASDPPEKAQRAAFLAMEVATGEREVADALGALTEDVEHAVAATLEGWSVSEYSMALAVALLENKPLDEVVAQAMRLDNRIRAAELDKEEVLPSRPIFDLPRNKLLDDIRAVADVRKHPSYPGLHEETVRFVRQGWADAVLRHIWREYHVSHTVLRDWMCFPALLHNFGGASARALCTLITQIPSHEPLWLVDHLASRRPVVQRELAVRVLNRLVHVHSLRPLVEETVAGWTAGESVYRKCTAALVCGSSFGRRDPARSMVTLQQLADSPNVTVQNSVVRGVLDLLAVQEDQETVLNSLMSWLWPAYSSFSRPDCLHTVALGVGMWVTGFTREAAPVTVEPALLAAQYPEQVGTLIEGILDDRRFGSLALRHLSQLAYAAELRRIREGVWSVHDEEAELLRLVTLFAPDLRWWRRLKIVATLGDRYPAHRAEIRHIFCTARKLQRAQGRLIRDTAPSLPMFAWR